MTALLRADDYDDDDDDGPLLTTWAGEIRIDLNKDDLIDGLLPKIGQSLLFGESGAGKTAVAVDIACHVAAGMPWRGMQVSRGAGVVYVAAEAPQSITRRLWAWMRYHKVTELPFLVVETPVDLLTTGAEQINSITDKVYRRYPHYSVGLVIIDTLARSMVGNENLGDDMGRYVAACGRISECNDAHVMTVHHTGKDLSKGARGHSSLRAAMDAELEVTPGLIHPTKVRDGATDGLFGFRIQPVELGENRHGRTVTAAVALDAAPPTKATRAPALSPQQKCLMGSLATAIADHGQPAPPGSNVPPNLSVVEFGRWEDAAILALPSNSPAWRRRSHFRRAAETLQTKGIVGQMDGWVWPT